MRPLRTHDASQSERYWRSVYTARKNGGLYDEGSFASAALVSIRGGLGCVVRQSALGSPLASDTHADQWRGVAAR